jgi:predicted outer membrane repeat protein
MVENEVCDQECYNLACNYDNSYCEDRCYEFMLGNGLCEEQCNKEEYQYDHWDCTCAPGCVQEMQMNGICDPQCYTESCNFDNDETCKHVLGACSNGCIRDYDYGYCNFECLTWSCDYYDSNSCDSKLIKHAFYTQAIKRDRFSPVDIFSNCLNPTSRDKNSIKSVICTLSKLGDGSCDAECNTEDCAYDLGDCSSDCHESCEICYGKNDPKKCLKCKQGKYLLYTACLDKCPYGFESSIKQGVLTCEISKKFMRIDSETFNIVQPAESNSHVDISGRYKFTSITNALANIRKSISLIYLKNIDNRHHMLKPIDKDKFSDALLLQSGDRPLDFSGFINVTEVSICPYECDSDRISECYDANSHAVIQWSSIIPIQLDISFRLIIHKVDLYGYNHITASPCIDNEYCTYCQKAYLDYVNSTTLNDRGKQITWNYAKESDCERYKDSTLFRITSTGHLIIANSKIYDWRAGFASIISNSKGKIELISVTFENIHLSSAPFSAVISSYDCDKSYRCGEINIKHCMMSLLNNGYEYDEDSYFSGFLYAKGLFQLQIEDSEFEYNLAYKGYNTFYDSPSIGSLIYLENFLLFKVLNTRFIANLSSNLIYIKSEAIYEQELDLNLDSYHANLAHIQLKNLIFSNNSGALLSISLQNELTNILLTNFTISDSISFTPLISIDLTSYNTLWRYDRNITLFLNYRQVTQTLNKRSAELSNLSFIRSYTSSSLFSIENIGNINVRSISIQNSLQNQNVSYSYLNECVISKFIENLDSYIINQVESGYLKYYPGTGSIGYLASISGLIIEDIEILENFSEKGSTSIDVVQPRDKVYMNRISVRGNLAQGEKAVTGFSVHDFGNEVFIEGVIADSNQSKTTSGYGVVFIKASSECEVCEVRIQNSEFRNNSGAFGVAIFAIISNFGIEDVHFEGNSISSGYGGGLYLNTRGKGPYIALISNCSFSHQQVSLGKGGAIAVDNISNTSSSLFLQITSSNFTSNYSLKHSSTLFISSSVSLSQDSIIESCSFISNESLENGNIYLQYFQGVLNIKDSRFEGNMGKYGIGIYSDIYSWNSLEENMVCKLILEGSSFVRNIAKEGAGSVVYKSNSGFYSRLESSNTIFEGNIGSAVHVEYGEWTDFSSDFRNNQGESVIILKNSAKVDISSSIFHNNTSINSSGVFEISDSSSLSLRNSTVSNNTSLQSGGAISIEGKSFIQIYNVTFSENRSDSKGSVIYSSGCNRPGSYISFSKLYSNYGKGGGSIYLLNSYLNISHSELFSNSDSSSSPGILLNLSVLNLQNSRIYNQSGHSGAGVYALTDSYISIYSSEFKDLHSNFGGGFLYTFNSQVEIMNSIINSTGAFSGGAIFANSDSKITILSSTFYNSTSIDSGSMLYARGSNITISSSYFNQFYNTAIVGTSLKSLRVTDSEFKNGRGLNGGAIGCMRCDVFEIKNTVFEDSSSQSGGAVNAMSDRDTSNTASLYVSNSRFERNKAQAGGAIYADNISLKLIGNYFGRNLALGTEIDSLRNGEGGAVSMKCTDLYFCRFSIENNTFIENSAVNSGGAVSWKHIEPTEVGNIYINNTALYGPNISSFPISFRLLDHPATFMSDYHRNSLYKPLGNISDISPGQSSKTIRIELIDVYNQTIFTDSTSIAELIPRSSESSEVIISGKSKVQAINGCFIFDDFTISSQPGSTVQILFTTPAIQESNKKSGKYPVYKFGMINIILRDCLLGEKRTDDKCIICPNNTYSIDLDDKECKECPYTAKCYGKFYILPKHGYWRTDFFSDRIFKCPNKDACLGEKYGESNSRVCKGGYEGNLCQVCEDGYARSNKYICSKCPESSINAVKIVVFIVVGLVVIIWIVRSTMRSAYKPKSTHSIYVKIFINYLQNVSVVAGFDLEWPEYVLEFLSIQENAGNLSDQILSIDCMLYEKDYIINQDHLYYFKLSMLLALPIIIILLSSLFWGLLALYHSKTSFLKHELISTIIILHFLIHPNLVNKMFHVFNCIEIEEGQFWMTDNLNIKCWTGKHVFYTITVAIPGIIIWGITVPLICLLFLIKNRRKLKDIEIRLKFGFLFNGYSAQYYYWEFVIISRKMFIICISVFLGSISVPVQALVAISVLITAFFLHLKHSPYEHKDLNEMERRSILVAMITIYCGLFYMSGGLNNIAKIVFFSVILIINAYFLLFWAKKFFTTGCKFLLSKVPYLRKRFIRGNILKLDDSFFRMSAKTTYSKRFQSASFINSRPLTTNYVEEPESPSLDFREIRSFYLQIVRIKNLTREIGNENIILQ